MKKINITKTFQKAMTAHENGNLNKAEKLYKQVLNINPNHPAANHNFGLLYFQCNKPNIAITFLKKALLLKPNNQQFKKSLENATAKLRNINNSNNYELDNKLLQLFQNNEYKDALKIATKAIEDNPNYTFGWKIKGIINRINGDISNAVINLKKALELNPNDTDILNNLGNILRELKKPEEAKKYLQQAISIKPENAIFQNNLGLILIDLKKTKEAVEKYQHAIKLNSNYANAYNNLGNALKELGKLEAAESHYRNAIQLNPNYAKANYNLANLLNELGRLDEAIVNYNKAIDLNPNFYEAYYNLANLLDTLGKVDEAIVNYNKAIDLNPNFYEAYNNLGSALRNMNKLEESKINFTKAIDLNSNFAEAYNNLGTTLRDLGDFKNATKNYLKCIEIQPDMVDAFSNILLSQSYEESSLPKYILENSKIYGNIISKKAIQKFNTWTNKSLKIRLGFVSGDFKKHPVGFFIDGLLQQLNKCKFELIAFPTIAKSDDLTVHIKSLFQEWHPIHSKNNYDAANLIHENNIDILIDLSGHTANNRLSVFAYKPAPIQVHYLGYMNTTGLPEIDYWIGDDIITPKEIAVNYTEEIWSIKRTWVSYSGNNSAPKPIFVKKDNKTIWLGSFNTLTKITPNTITLWSHILYKIPHAKLILKTKELSSPNNCARILNDFKKHDIEESRIILVDSKTTPTWNSHMNYYNHIDIALDPIGPMSGGTTTCDALWMGVPVITKLGDRMSSRMSASMLNGIGRDEWIAKDDDEYIAKVIDLAQDDEKRKKIKITQRNNMKDSQLCNAKELALTLEGAFESMHNKYIEIKNK